MALKEDNYFSKQEDFSKKQVSVVLPSYNEKDNIKEAINRVKKCLGKDLFEVIIVDDNSPDGTWKVVQDMDDDKVKLIRRFNDKGLASALSDGIKAAEGNIIVWMDCDLGIPPERIPVMVSNIGKYDVVIGSRYVNGGKDTRPFFRTFLSVLINGYAQIILSFKVRDYTSGIVAVKTSVMKKINFSRKGFGEYFIEFAYKCIKNKYKVKEIPVVYVTRKAGKSKSDGSLLKLLKYGWDYGIFVLKVRLGIVK